MKREIGFKTKVRCYLIPTRIHKMSRLTTSNIGETMEQLKFSYIVSGIIKQYKYFGKLFTKLNMHLP